MKFKCSHNFSSFISKNISVNTIDIFIWKGNLSNRTRKNVKHSFGRLKQVETVSFSMEVQNAVGSVLL